MFFFHQRGRLMVLGGKRLFLSLYPPGPPKQAQTIAQDFCIDTERFLMKKLEYFPTYRCLKISVYQVIVKCDRKLGILDLYKNNFLSVCQIQIVGGIWPSDASVVAANRQRWPVKSGENRTTCVSSQELLRKKSV